MHEAVTKIAGEPIWTHQLPRVCREIQSAALARLPALQQAIDEAKQITHENYETWRDAWVDRYGPTIAIPTLSHDEHERIDPLSEAVEMGVHPDEILVVKK